LDGSRPPHARPDKRPARGAIHALSRADAAHGRHAGLDEAGAMGVGTEAAIRHAPIPGLSSGVHLLHLGQLMGQAGGDHQLQEQARAGVAPPQEVGHGHAASRPWLRRRTAGLLEGRGIGPGAARTIDHQGAMPMPPPGI
jgi:hypothetical protein